MEDLKKLREELENRIELSYVLNEKRDDMLNFKENIGSNHSKIILNKMGAQNIDGKDSLYQFKTILSPAEVEMVVELLLNEWENKIDDNEYRIKEILIGGQNAK